MTMLYALRASVPMVLLVIGEISASCARESCESKYDPFYEGRCKNVENCEGGTLSGLCEGPKLIKCCVPEINPIPEPAQPIIKKELFLKLMGETARNKALFKYINKAMRDAGVLSCHCQAAFLAQTAHESDSFKCLEEYGDGSTYEGKLGNTEEGDGRKFIGRGFIQLTGRENYEKVAKGTGQSIIKDQPESVAIPSVACDVTAWMWKNGFRIVLGNKLEASSLSNLCDGTTYSFYLMTLAINGGLNGIKDRLERWDKALKCLDCPPKSPGSHVACSDSSGKTGHCTFKDLCTGKWIVSSSCPQVKDDRIRCCMP